MKLLVMFWRILIKVKQMTKYIGQLRANSRHTCIGIMIFMVNSIICVDTSTLKL